MADIVDRATRSRMMSGIRSKNTKPEILIRTALFSRGFRYRLHARNLPGKPDIVLPRYKTAIFVHGCFWHGHDCDLFKWPKSNRVFWSNKIRKNRSNDTRNHLLLADLGWRVAIVWECITRQNSKPLNSVVDRIERWISSPRRFLELGRGRSKVTNTRKAKARG